MRNRLKFIILEIIVEKENEDLNDTIISQISNSCDVSTRTVKRWINNQLQPPLPALANILNVLQAYKTGLTYEQLLKDSAYQNKVKEKFNLSK